VQQNQYRDEADSYLLEYVFQLRAARWYLVEFHDESCWSRPTCRCSRRRAAPLWSRVLYYFACGSPRLTGGSVGRPDTTEVAQSSRLGIIRIGAVTTGPNTGFEIFVPGRQDCS